MHKWIGKRILVAKGNFKHFINFSEVFVV